MVKINGTCVNYEYVLETLTKLGVTVEEEDTYAGVIKLSNGLISIGSFDREYGTYILIGTGLNTLTEAASSTLVGLLHRYYQTVKNRRATETEKKWGLK